MRSLTWRGRAAGCPASCSFACSTAGRFAARRTACVLGEAGRRPPAPAVVESPVTLASLGPATAVGPDHVRLPVVEEELGGLPDLVLGRVADVGSATVISSLPESRISGSATPSLSMRLRMMSIARSAIACRLSACGRLALVDELMPPFRSSPSFVGFAGDATRAATPREPGDDQQGRGSCGVGRSWRHQR